MKCKQVPAAQRPVISPARQKSAQETLRADFAARANDLPTVGVNPITPTVKDVRKIIG